ncbi:MAG: hypothetical protein HRT87_02230 [Legionellales bacterium]|nr:hypothetical protein [Legionellales bacterium]
MVNKSIIWIIISLFVLNLHAEMADPTKPPKKLAPKVTVETEPLRLKMIRLDNKNGKHTANINGEIVKIGGVYADAKVVDITDEYVELQGPKGEKIILKLLRRKHKSDSGDLVNDEIFEDVKNPIKTHLKENYDN